MYFNVIWIIFCLCFGGYSEWLKALRMDRFCWGWTAQSYAAGQETRPLTSLLNRKCWTGVYPNQWTFQSCILNQMYSWNKPRDILKMIKIMAGSNSLTVKILIHLSVAGRPAWWPVHLFVDEVVTSWILWITADKYVAGLSKGTQG